MKRWLLLALMLTGCPDPHTADRARNTAVAAEYEVALEDCIGKAIDAKNAGVTVNKVLADYDACADAADAKFGRRSQ